MYNANLKEKNEKNVTLTVENILRIMYFQRIVKKIFMINYMLKMI